MAPVKPVQLVSWTPPTIAFKGPVPRSYLGAALQQHQYAHNHLNNGHDRGSPPLRWAGSQPPQPPSLLQSALSAPSLIYSTYTKCPDLALAASVRSAAPAPPPPTILPTHTLAYEQEPLPAIGEGAAPPDGEGSPIAGGGGGSPQHSSPRSLTRSPTGRGSPIYELADPNAASATAAAAPGVRRRSEAAQAEVGYRAAREREVKHSLASRWGADRGGGYSIRSMIIDEARKRIGHPPRAKHKAHMVNLNVVVAGLVRNRRAKNALRKCETFRSLTRLQRATLANSGSHSVAKRYSAVYRAGSQASCFYILLRGSLYVQPDEGGADPYTITVERGDHAGVVFGVESLNPEGIGRTATVTALEASELVSFGTRGITLDENGKVNLAREVFNETAEAALRRTPLFKDLDPHKLRQIAPLFKLEVVDSEQAVFLEGDVPDKLYILLNGSVDLVKDNVHVASLDGATTLVGDGHPFFGAAAVLGGGRRPWDVFTRTPCNLLVLPVRSFRPFMRTVPEFRERLAEYAEARRRSWELETGMVLSVAATNAEEDIMQEAAVAVQRGIRGKLARKDYNEQRQKALDARKKDRNKARMSIGYRLSPNIVKKAEPKE